MSLFNVSRSAPSHIFLNTFRTILFSGLMLVGLSVSAADKKQSLSQAAFSQFQAIFALMEQEQWGEAKQSLNALLKESDSAYVKALANFNLGKIALNNDQYRRAIKSFKSARALNVLPKEQNLNLLHIIGQLHCQVDQWRSCAKVLEQWVQLAPNEAKGQDFILIAQAYAQQQHWKSVVKPVNKALSLGDRGQSGGIYIPKNWLQIAVVAHVELAQWKSAVKRQQQLLKSYPAEAGDWRQLVSLHLQQDHFEQGLAVQRLGFKRGVLTQKDDYQLLAQLLLNKGVPSQAGDILAEGFSKKILSEDEKTLKLLSQSWVYAKEWKKAEKALSSLNQIKRDVGTARQLAQVRMQLHEWQAASESIKTALRASKNNNADLYLMLGITQINMENFDAARESFDKAMGEKSQQQTAKSWLNYIERLES